MAEETALTVVPGSYAEIAEIGKAMVASGYFKDAAKQSQAIVKILAGKELGFGPFASMTGINIIKGKPAIGGNLMAAKVKAHPRYDYRVARLDNDACELVFYENAQEIGRSIFTMEDAQAAETGKLVAPGASRSMLARFARNMLFNRAISNGVRWFCPDVFMGATVYTPGELGAETDDGGDVINVTPTPLPTPDPTQESAPKPEKAPPPQQGNGKKIKGVTFPLEILDMVIRAHYADDRSGAARRLGKSRALDAKDAPDVIVGWAGLYHGYREAGESPDDAARFADDELYSAMGPDQEGPYPVDGEEAREMAGTC